MADSAEVANQKVQKRLERAKALTKQVHDINTYQAYQWLEEQEAVEAQRVTLDAFYESLYPGVDTLEQARAELQRLTEADELGGDTERKLLERWMYLLELKKDEEL